MGKWIARGTAQNSGKPAKVEVEAGDEAQAIRRAMRRGLVVESVTIVSGDVVLASPPPVPAQSPTPAAAPTPPAGVDKFVQNLIGDGQDAAVVSKVAEKVRSILTREEQLQYIAVQKKPVFTPSPDCIALTNRRIIVVRQKMLGRMDFADALWQDVQDVHMQEHMLGAEVTVATTTRPPMKIEHVPKAQARAIYRQAQEAEENARNRRREMDLEERRASADQTNVLTQTAPASAAPAAVDSPMSKLKELKEMLDGGLISADDYELHKSRIMSKM